MPIRHQKFFSVCLSCTLWLSAVTPLLAQGQSQRQRRPSAPSAQDELDRINEERMREINGDPPAPARKAVKPARVTIIDNADADAPTNALLNAAPGTLPEGTVIATQMVTKLSSKTAQAGDRLRAKVIYPVTDRNRNVLIPAGSSIEGQVQDVVRARSRRRSGMIEISFDRLRIGNQVYPIEATLAPLSSGDRKRLDADGRLAQSGGGVKRTFAFVGGGAGAGAAIGYVAGSAIWGAGIGAGVGVAVLLLSKGKEAEVETGMKIGAELLTTIRLNSVANDNLASDSQLDDNDTRSNQRDNPDNNYAYDPREVKNRNNTGATVLPPVAPPVRTPRVPNVGTKPLPAPTPNKNANTGKATPSAPVNRADRQLVNVTNVLAERGSDDTVRVSVTGQTPTAGWKLVPESTLENGVLNIKLYGVPPQSLAAQVISSATTVIREDDPSRAIQRVTVRGATNLRTTIPISRDTKNTGGNNTAPAPSNPNRPNQEDLSTLGMRIADKSNALLEDYARSLRAWRNNDRYSFENARDEATPEAQLLLAFDRLHEAAAVFRSPLNVEAKRRAVRDLVNSHLQINRLWPQVKVAPEFKQRWQDIQGETNQLAASVPGATGPRVINPNQPRPRS
jgi:hypothetical protein